MQLAIHKRFLALERNLEVLFLNIHCEVARAQRQAGRQAELLGAEHDLQLLERLSPRVLVCNAAVVHRLGALAFIIVIALVTVLLCLGRLLGLGRLHHAIGRGRLLGRFFCLARSLFLGNLLLACLGNGRLLLFRFLLPFLGLESLLFVIVLVDALPFLVLGF